MSAADSHALMEREIRAQPPTLAAMLGELTTACKALTPRRGCRVWIFGCGDGLFAGQSVAHIARLGGLEPRPVSAAEMLWDAAPAPGDTCVGISVSGGTVRTVEAMRKARASGARTIALTINRSSALALEAEETLSLPYTPISRKTPHTLDHGVTLLSLAALLGVELTALSRAVEVLEHALEPLSERARACVAQVEPNARLFFIGGGAALGTANYGAAKLHEAGGVLGLAFEADNVGHGAHLAMRPGDHAVLLGGGGSADARSHALAAGLERLGLGVSQAGFDDDIFRGLFEATLWCQLLCLELARVRELDVTAPDALSAANEVQAAWFAWRAETS